MVKGDSALLDPGALPVREIFQQFIEVFSRRGWLNETLRIRHQGRRYRISCSGKEFLAYRINENCGVTPGIPGWPVCMINHERIIEDSHMSAFVSDEPRAYEWLVHLADSQVEII